MLMSNLEKMMTFRVKQKFEEDYADNTMNLDYFEECYKYKYNLSDEEVSFLLDKYNIELVE